METIRNLELVSAGADDADRVAQLHAESWRATYRGIFGDFYLEGPVYEERRDFWRERMAAPDPARRHTLIARAGTADAGFMCTLLDGEPEYGAVLDNLHVLPPFKGAGIGRRLMAEAARFVIERAPGRSLYLFVYETNLAAQRFYSALGGENVARVPDTTPDGAARWTFRYLWRDPRILI